MKGREIKYKSFNFFGIILEDFFRDKIANAIFIPIEICKKKINLFL